MVLENFSWNKPAWDHVMAAKTRLPHGILVAGRKGVGKLRFARRLAAVLLCEGGSVSGEPCGKCPACLWLASEVHPDFRLIEPESLASQGALAEETEEKAKASDKKLSKQISVEQVRELADFVNISSHRGGAKVILIHPAESLNVHAANALLKTLEEPPFRTFFILVSHRPQRLLPTIRSRCQQISLAAPEREIAAGWLREQGVQNPELSLALAGYAPLDALDLQAEDYWNERAVLLDGLSSRSFDPLGLAERIQHYDLGRVLNWLQKWSYDMIFLKFAGQVRYHLDFRPALEDLSGRLETVEVIRYHRELLKWQPLINHPLNPRLFVEHLLLSYARLAEVRGYAHG